MKSLDLKVIELNQIDLSILDNDFYLKLLNHILELKNNICLSRVGS